MWCSIQHTTLRPNRKQQLAELSKKENVTRERSRGSRFTDTWPYASRITHHARCSDALLLATRHVSLSTWLSMSRSLWRHTDRPIQPDHLAVEHLVLDDLPHQRGILGRAAQARRERH